MDHAKAMRAIVTTGYRVLAKQCHPDAGGSHEDMVTLTAAKDAVLAMLGANVPPSEEPRRKAPKPAQWTDKDWVEIDDVTVVYESARAILCQVGDDEEEIWIPLSQIHDDSPVKEQGDEGTLVITRWLAKRKGLVDG